MRRVRDNAPYPKPAGSSAFARPAARQGDPALQVFPRTATQFEQDVAENGQRRTHADKPVAVLDVEAVVPDPAGITRNGHGLRAAEINGASGVHQCRPDAAKLVEHGDW